MAVAQAHVVVKTLDKARPTIGNLAGAWQAAGVVASHKIELMTRSKG